MLLFAGDIGGTNTRLGIFSWDKGFRTPLHEATYRSTDYASLEEVCADFLPSTQVTVAGGVFGVAGPVGESRIRLTNLPWVIDRDSLASKLSLPRLVVLNDLEAIAFGIDVLTKNDLKKISSTGAIKPHGTRAILAPGTGLGQAFMTWDGSRYRTHPSEGGHGDFAPGNERERALLAYLLRRFDRVSWERVCSGSAIPAIYEFLKDEGYCVEPERLAEKRAGAEDMTALILTTAVHDVHPPDICRETLHMFLSILGAQAGNLALTLIPTGGLYLGGGIIPRIADSLEEGPFMDAFLSKGRLAPLLATIPVIIILDEKVALWGAARRGFELMAGG
ncbi:MAG: glucokinase [Syntrophales bacterium]|jgi:glucokinase|nr:glucokinase [Syntrophales bacterium]MCK9528520.1 glucokinase [Syntrophales bacterium]MDX9922854.1 glucokinase [Syntrophales bacterium]